MNTPAATALIIAAIVFGLIVLIPIASFLLRAAVIAALAGLAVYVLLMMTG